MLPESFRDRYSFPARQSPTALAVADFPTHRYLSPPVNSAQNATMKKQRYHVVDFAALQPVACPCGQAFRALAEVDAFPGTIHRTEISGTARAHYHQRLTETYYVLEAAAGSFVELDGDQVPVRPGVCLVIPPGVVHRAVGPMVILNIVIPKFDPQDEILVE